ncbi:MAG: heavy metal translocating P-type ATPase [Trueperaceae bacterium]|nr:heavy metal translocating P-type ATPase [Trueperaceae bacterium]
MAAVFTGLTGLGLAAAVLAVVVGRAYDGQGSGWLADYVGVGGVAGLVAAVGLAVAFLAGGVPAAAEALAELTRERKFDIDLLMVLAAVAAALVGEPRDGAVLLFLFSLAGTLEDHAFTNTKGAVAALMQLKPETATLLEGDELRVVPSDSVPIGARLLVRPGERVPLDGVLERGASSVDQSPITGESVPVDKAVGDALFAGSINGYGALELRVTKDASSSTLARMIELVTEARASRSPSQRFSDWFGQRYTVLVIAGTALALAAFLLSGTDPHAAFYKAATLLVVASPCAIVISVPAAVLSALARAARMGVLFKGGGALERFGAVTTIAFDKTGTLTEGRMQVTNIMAFGQSDDAALAAAAAIEAASDHPLAKALCLAADSRGLACPTPSDVVAVPGKGLVGKLAGTPHWVGNRKLAAELGVGLAEEAAAALARLESAGKTVVILGDAQRVTGLFGMADVVRPSAAPALSQLARAGVKRFAMLTGDHAAVARDVGRTLGLGSEGVRADLLPDEKVAVVRELGAGGTVAFVGDGVNDAAALASADVGVAMGVAGSDAALEAADVALLSDDLSRLPEAFELAKRANGVIRQNLAFALGIMVLMVIVTLFSHLPLPLGVIGHEGGTILVVANGLRLLGFAPRAHKDAERPATTLSTSVS